MNKRRVLVAWIGHSDLKAMALSLGNAAGAQILSELGGAKPAAGECGPIKTLIDAESFDEVRLLSDYRPAWNKLYRNWLTKKATIIPVDLKRPTDYDAIFRIADNELRKLTTEAADRPFELCLHLSPGTPAMTAVWLLLGKTRYPATFYETHQSKAWKTEIPFDLTLDVLPELLRRADTQFAHLAAHAPSQVEGFGDIIGESQAIRVAVGRAGRAALHGVAILLLGESGTGKEMFAQAIHKASPRRDWRFVAVNCAALSRELLESELFGHRKGSFTGAERDHGGAFEQADGGTLFLDEVGECAPALQAKLLRVLQPPAGEGLCHRVFRRVGDDEERTSDVRIIAATNRDLLAEVRDRRFREDLYHRLAVITINLPPLRDRRSDVPKIAERLLAQINDQFAAAEPGYGHKKLSDAAIRFVKRHPWPGNVRQLYNVLLQAAVMADGDVLNEGDLASALGEMPSGPLAEGQVLAHTLGDGFVLEDHLNEIRRHYLRRAMEEADGVKAKAARLLGMENYQTLAEQLQRLNVKASRKKNE
jgi:transcriptional regulator with PAS, ATPase and Fis domain